MTTEGEKETVYLETSFISYLVSRPSRDLLVAAHQQVTQSWWDRRRQDFRIVISDYVLQEIKLGDSDQSKKRFEIVRGLTSFTITEVVMNFAEQVIEKGILPENASADAVHIALAAMNGVDYLLTWNCRHLANAEIEKKLSRFYLAAGYELPIICTPLELMGDRDIS